MRILGHFYLVLSQSRIGESSRDSASVVKTVLLKKIIQLLPFKLRLWHRKMV